MYSFIRGGKGVDRDIRILDDISATLKLGRTMCKESVVEMGLAGPGKNGVIRGFLYDFLLASDECMVAFTIEHWHINTKDSQEAVGNVLYPRSYPC